MCPMFCRGRQVVSRFRIRDATQTQRDRVSLQMVRFPEFQSRKHVSNREEFHAPQQKFHDVSRTEDSLPGVSFLPLLSDIQALRKVPQALLHRMFVHLEYVCAASFSPMVNWVLVPFPKTNTVFFNSKFTAKVAKDARIS